MFNSYLQLELRRKDIIKQWPISSLLPMCTTDAGLSIEHHRTKKKAGAINFIGINLILLKMSANCEQAEHN